MNNKIVLLLSGGIDSTILLYWLLEKNYDVYPFYINYGQNTYEGEIKSIKKILPEELLNQTFFLEIPNIKFIGSGTLSNELPEDISSQKEWFQKEFFPNRNMILISLASSYAIKNNITNIAIGVVGENSYSDTKKDFLNSLKKSLCLSLDSTMNIVAPFAELNRKEIIKFASKLEVPLLSTFSCNSLGNKHCLFCNSCREREEAIKIFKNLKFKME